MKGKIYVHKKTGRRVKVLNEPGWEWEYAELLYLDQDGPIRHGKKLWRYFNYDYEEEALCSTSGH